MELTLISQKVDFCGHFDKNWVWIFFTTFSFPNNTQSSQCGKTKLRQRSEVVKLCN